MSALGLDFTIVSVTTPPFVMTLGSAYSVHVLTAYLLPDTPDRDGTAPRARPRSGAGSRHRSRPSPRWAATVILAAVTTAAGFGGLATASVAAVREFGVITGLGVAYCAILALLFLPACLQVLQVRPPAARAAAAGRRPLLLAALAAWVLRHRRVIVIVVPAGVPSARVRDAPAALRDRLHAFLPRCRHGDGQQPARAAPTWRVRGLQRHHDRSARCVGVRCRPVSSSIHRRCRRWGAIRAPSACSARRELELLLRYPSCSAMNQALTGSHAVPERRAAVLLLARLMAARQTAGVAQGPSPIDLDGSQLHMNARVFDSEHGTFFLEGPIPGVSGARRAACEANCFRPTSRSASGAAAWRRCASPRCWRATT